MRKGIFFLIILLAYYSTRAYSQTNLSNLPPFGDISEEEFAMKECSFDKEANSVIIFSEAYADHDEDYHLITKRRVRIKILNEKGLDDANIEIPFYSNDNYEFLKDMKAATFNRNTDGTIASFYVDKRSFFTDKKDRNYSLLKFAMPNVKAGSVIEYEYESVKKGYSKFQNWEFQDELPVMKSCYLLQIPPAAEFTYSVQKKATYPITIKPLPEIGQIYFEMKNIPGLKFEPYMDAIGDHLQKVVLQFSGMTDENNSTRNENTTWKDAAYNLSTDKDFGPGKRSLSSIDDVKALAEKETTMQGKLAAIYDYVRKNITWNGYYGTIYNADEPKTVWDKKNGSATGINMVLLNLLQSFNIEAYPILVSEREHGRIDTTFPFLTKFDRTAVYAIADNNEFILDASQKTSPPNLIPFSLLNTYAFVVDKKKYKLVRINSNASAYRDQVFVKGSLSEKGVLNGSTNIISQDYSKQSRTESIKKDEKKYVGKTFQEAYEGMVVDSFHCENLDNDNEPLIQHINFENALSESGGFVLFNYNMFSGFEKNPFTKPERFTNIDFGCPYAVSVDEDIELPKNAKTDDLPKDKMLTTPQKDITISRKIKQDGNTLRIRLDFIQSVTLVYADQYEYLKQFYRSMTDMLNEPIVIKLQK